MTKPEAIHAAAARGVVARIVTGPHDAHRQDPHLPMRYDTGRPRAVARMEAKRVIPIPPPPPEVGAERIT